MSIQNNERLRASNINKNSSISFRVTHDESDWQDSLDYARKISSSLPVLALKYYDQVISQLPSVLTNQQKAELFYERSRVQIGLNNVELALSDINEAIKLDNSNAEYYFIQGIVLKELKKWRLAAKAFGKAIELNLKENYLFRRAEVYLEWKKFELALIDLERAIPLAPNGAPYYNLRGIIYSQMDQREEAIKAFTRAIELAPEQAILYVSRAGEYLQLEKNQEALIDLNKAIDLQPSAENYCERGAFFAVTGSYYEALVDFNQAIKLSPLKCEFYCARALAHHKLKQYPQALADLKKTIEMEPGNPRYHMERAQVFFELADYRKALVDVASAIEHDLNDAEYYSFRAGIHMRLEQHDAATVDLEQAIKLKPQMDDYYQRGVLFERLGRDSDALVDYEKAIELSSGKNAVYHFAHGNVCCRQKKYDQALSGLNIAISLSSEVAEFYYGRAVILVNIKETGQALQDFLKAIQIDPNVAKYWYVLAELYHQLNNTTEAIKSLTNAVRLEPDNADFYNSLGNLFFASDRDEQAFDYFSKAVMYSSNKKFTLSEETAWVFKCEAFMNFYLRKYDDSLEIYNKVIQTSKKSLYRLYRGKVYLALEEYQKAIEDFDHMLESEPNNYLALKLRKIASEAQAKVTASNNQKELAIEFDYKKIQDQLSGGSELAALRQELKQERQLRQELEQQLNKMSEQIAQLNQIIKYKLSDDNKENSQEISTVKAQASSGK